MKNLNVKSRLAMFGTASFLLLAVTGTAQAELVDETRTSMSRSTIQVDHSSVSMALAAKQSYRSQSSYKWANHEPSPPPADSTWADNKESDSGYKWAVTQLPASESQQNVSQTLRSNGEHSTDAIQAGYRWGIRNVADQAGYRWGIRNVADQAGYRWGIRNVADQAGYRWGIR